MNPSKQNRKYCASGWKSTGTEASQRLEALTVLQALTRATSDLRASLLKALPERSVVSHQCTVVQNIFDVARGCSWRNPNTTWSSVLSLNAAILDGVNKSGDRDFLENIRECAGGESADEAAEVAKGWAAPENADRRAALIEVIARAVASINMGICKMYRRCTLYSTGFKHERRPGEAAAKYYSIGMQELRKR